MADRDVLNFIIFIEIIIKHVSVFELQGRVYLQLQNFLNTKFFMHTINSFVM
jgi:hypothetical protein